MTRSNFSRRRFLQTSAAAAAAAGVPYFGWTAETIGQDAKTESKNDRPILGCIGTGDRWNAVGPAAMKFGDCVAVCDVDAAHMEKGKKRAMDENSKKGRERTVEMYDDYRKLLDRKDIEVVTIVTPDHWHSKIAIEAMKAGKDVYCEKPLTLTIDEGKQILKVLKETGRVFQVGTQQRSEMAVNRGQVAQGFLTAVALCREGRLGKIQKVECRIGGSTKSPELPEVPVPTGLNWEMWCGQAPLAKYVSSPTGSSNRGYPASRCHYEFRWWYEYSGGKMTDWGAHHVDIASWAIGMDYSGPTTVEGVTDENGKLVAVHPVEFKDGWPTVDNQYNAATKFDVKCMYPNGVELHILSDGENGIQITGDKSELFVSRSVLRGKAYDEMKENPLPEGTLAKLYKGKKPGNHMGNFFECCADRTQPISDVPTHHRSMTTCHLANIAIRLGRPLKWDAEKEQIVGDEAANAFLKREQRKGYEIVT